MENDLNTFDANAVPETAEQAEALINHWQSEGETPEQNAGESEPEKTPEEISYEINYRGKKESYPVSKLVEFAQQGRDYAEKMGHFNRERSTFDKERTGWKSEYEKQKTALEEYKTWHKAASEHPGWLDTVRQSYQQRLQTQGEQSPNDPLVQKLLATVEDLTGKFSKIEEKETLAAITQEDQDLDLEISEYKGKFPDLNWGQVDENGLDLEKRVLDHAIKIKPPSFRAAANDLLHDEHLARAQGRAKENVGKEIQKATKLGLGPPTKTRQLAPKKVDNVSSKSWEDVHAEAMAAMGER